MPASQTKLSHTQLSSEHGDGSIDFIKTAALVPVWYNFSNLLTMVVQ